MGCGPADFEQVSPSIPPKHRKYSMITEEFLEQHRKKRHSRRALLRYPFADKSLLPRLLRQNTRSMQQLERWLLLQLPSVSLMVGAERGNSTRATSGGVTISRRKGESPAAFRRRAVEAFPFADATDGLLLMRTIIFSQ